MANFIEKAFGKLFGNKHEKDVKALRPRVATINKHFESYAQLSNDALRQKTTEFKSRIADHLKSIDDEIAQLKGEAQNDELTIQDKEDLYFRVDELTKKRDEELEVVLDQILPEAFATVKETARRFAKGEVMTAAATDLDRELSVTHENIVITNDQVSYQPVWMAAGGEVDWKMVHYDVQLIGGMVLHSGKIAEMQTGEGKTLVATLPAYLNGIAGLGVHVVTVNDYLARRDSEWMAPIFQFLGLTIDCIDKHQPNSPERRRAYHADITYGTNNGFGFDYLRDNMVHHPDELVQRKHHFAMVDEVDSVLVDDARTPLIISGPVEQGGEKEYYNQKPRIAKLYETQKKLVTKCLSEAKRLIKEGNTGNKPGEGGFLLFQAYRGLPKNNALIKFLSEPGMKQIMLKTEAYYLQDQAKEMPTIDKDLYFVIDEKTNSVELAERGIDLITGNSEDPEMFVVPDVGAAIAELEKSDLSDEEKVKQKDTLMQNFSIKSERLHVLQQLLKAYTLFEKEVEYVVMDNTVKIVDENTGRIMEGRRYSDGLHQAIEAKENTKINAASQTFATVTLQNFFRMYHKLSGMTGTAETEAAEFWEIYKLDTVVIPTNKPIQRDDQEDVVYKTKREKYSALIEDVINIQNQGRPILVGTTDVESSELISRMLKMKGIKHNVLNAKQHQREAEIVAEAGKDGAITIATNMAGRGTDIKISDEVKKAGGLAIIGTERHDSRRIDRQLRGRAGRQGDPGSSLFYVSLEDKLMRLFGSDRISKVMDRMGHEDGEMIQHSMISKSIERAQKKVEENSFGTRKHLLEYDDVMNKQREVIYDKRRHALFGDRLTLDLLNGFYDLCEELVNTHQANRNYEQFELDVIRFFSVQTSITEDQLVKQKAQDLVKTLYLEVKEAYTRKCEQMKVATMPIFQRIHETRGETIRLVGVPSTDGKRGLSFQVNLQNAIDNDGEEIIKAFEKSVSLAILDETWKEHLREMDFLKNEVQAARYEQKDPLLIYKLEAYNLFEAMVSDLNKGIASYLMKAVIPIQNDNEVQSAERQRTNLDKMKAGRNEVGQPNNVGTNQPEKKMQPVRVEKKVGRNDPCPCGSGKKYKQCHGKLQTAN